MKSYWPPNNRHRGQVEVTAAVAFLAVSHRDAEGVSPPQKRPLAGGCLSQLRPPKPRPRSRLLGNMTASGLRGDSSRSAVSCKRERADGEAGRRPPSPQSWPSGGALATSSIYPHFCTAPTCFRRWCHRLLFALRLCGFA
jgi:hypothetical protein